MLAIKSVTQIDLVFTDTSKASYHGMTIHRRIFSSTGFQFIETLYMMFLAVRTVVDMFEQRADYHLIVHKHGIGVVIGNIH